MPSVRYSNERSAMARLGNCAIITDTSRTMVQRRVACSNAATSNEESELRKGRRLIEARLHAVSSRNMYSLHGLLATIGPDAGQVCQSFTVVWNCKPGSAQAQAA